MGIALACAVPRGWFGWLEFGMRTAATVEEGWQLLARYSAMLNRDAGFVYAARPDGCILAYETPRSKGGLGAQLNEFTIALVLAKSREVSSKSWIPTRAWFAHAEPSSPDVGAWFGCPVTFGEESSGFAVERAVARTPLHTHDPSLHDLLRKRLDELMPVAESARTTTARVRAEILSRLGRGPLVVSDVARALGTSSRTLQRELAGENATFASLVDLARRGIAETLLARLDLSIGEVGAMLGYADLRGFERAFVRWTGTSPTQWRSRHTS